MHMINDSVKINIQFVILPYSEFIGE